MKRLYINLFPTLGDQRFMSSIYKRRWEYLIFLATSEALDFILVYYRSTATNLLFQIFQRCRNILTTFMTFMAIMTLMTHNLI